MILKKQLKLVNWGTQVRVSDDSGVLIEGEIREVTSSPVYDEYQNSFVKSLKLEKCNDTSVLCIRVKKTD